MEDKKENKKYMKWIQKIHDHPVNYSQSKALYSFSK